MIASSSSRRDHRAAAGRRRAASRCASLALALLAFPAWADPAPVPSSAATAAAPPPAAARLARRDDDPCATVWFRDGAKVQMEADGAMPMSRHTVQQRPQVSGDTCTTQLQIHSKTALAALMEPPVTTDQQYAVVIVPPRGDAPGHVEGGAVVDASGHYVRLHGETRSMGRGVFDYAHQDLSEGKELGGESVTSRASFVIYARDSGDEVGRLEMPHATLQVASRRVGKRQHIDTALGSIECVPIRYERVTDLGPLQVAGDAIPTQPTVMQITDWYCPSQGFVMRSDVEENGKVQRIDTTSIEALDATDEP